MSIAEVTGRIAQIRSELAGLAAPVATPSSGAAGTTFSSVLSAAQAGAGVEQTASSWSPGAAATAAMGPAGEPTGAVGGQAVVDEARRYLGVPYVWGGTDPAKGLDCSGLVQLVYRNLGIDLPRVSYDQAKVGRAVPSLAEARPGDILGFGDPVEHVAIYIGGGKMIEAPRTGLDVRVSDVYEKPTVIRRVLPDQPVAVGAAGRVDAGTAGGAAVLPAGTPYASLFTEAARRNGLSPTLLAAVAMQESGFDARAVSPAGAKGLMQLMPSTAAGLGVRNPFDPAQAIDGAARLLGDLVSEFGRVDLALAAYNAGPGAVHRYGGIPPYPETRRYVPSVLAHQSALERT